MKRTIALASAAVMLMASAVSCSGSSEKDNQTADKLLNNSYRSQPLDFPEGITRIQSMYVTNDKKEVIICGYDEGVYQDLKLFKTDMDFTDYKEISLDFDLPETGEVSVSVTVNNDGNLLACISQTTHGDMEEPDWEDENFDYESFDFDAYYDAAEYSYFLRTYGEDGSLINDFQVEGIEGAQYLTGITQISDDRYFIRFGGDEVYMAIYDSEGNVVNQVEAGNFDWCDYASIGSDGNIYCSVSGEKGQELRVLDSKTLKFTDKKIDLNDIPGGYMGNEPFAGTGDYVLMLLLNKGLYGLKADDSVTECVNWVDSDILWNDISSAIALENGDYIIASYSYDTNSGSLSRLTKRDASEIENTKVITLASIYEDSNLNANITDFNKKNSEYRIKLKTYSDDYDDEKDELINSAESKLMRDIITGNAPDLLVGNISVPVEKLKSKGVFADLYEFMDKDEELSRDKFLPNILKALESDGKLYSITNSFSVNTQVAKTKYVKGLENWTLDQMIDVCSKLPEDMKVFKSNNSKEGAFYSIYWGIIGDFVDYSTNTCSFDSEESKKFLEFCGTFPEKDDAEPDFEDMTQEEMQAYWSEYETMIQRDKALISDIYISQFRDYGRIRQAEVGDDLTFVGFPSSDGCGGILDTWTRYAILDSSKNKDIAWQFIKDYYFSEEAYNDQGGIYVLKEYFDKQAEESMERPYYINEKGEKEYYDDSYYIADKEIKIKPLTKEEVEMLKEYILSIDKVQFGLTFQDPVYSIIDEEIKPFFAGDKSAEKTLELIQNRAKIAVSEQY